MGWNCKNCGTYNEDKDTECIVCGESRSTAEYKEATPTVLKPSTSTPPRTTTSPGTTTTPRTTSTPRTTTTEMPRRERRSRYIVGTEAKKRISKIIAFCLIALSFIVGQVLLYLFFCTRDTVFALTALVERSGNSDFNTTAFIASMTVVGAIAGILICCDISYFIERRKYAYVWLITLPYCITMVVIPSLISCLVFAFGVVFAIVKKYGAIKPFTIIYVALMAASIIVFPSVAAGVSNDAPESIQYESATYARAEDGKYYVTEYSGDKDLLPIPITINEKYQVGGVSEEFKGSKEFYIFELNFEHASMLINYCTVCGGELGIPVSEKEEQHQCPTCGVIMTTLIERKRIDGEDVLSVIIDRESLKHLKLGYERIGKAWLGEDKQ